MGVSGSFARATDFFKVLSPVGGFAFVFGCFLPGRLLFKFWCVLAWRAYPPQKKLSKQNCAKLSNGSLDRFHDWNKVG